MTGEFEKQLRQMTLDPGVREKIIKMVNVAGEEFPCLSCPSKDECDNFKWFVRWFKQEDTSQ